MAKIIDRRSKSMGGNDKRAVSRITNIAVHYSATSEGSTSAFERFWKGTHGWNTGGYHEVVLTNGDVELNYNADTISNGVGGQNTRMYNICYVGDGAPNAAQLKTLIERVNYNRNRFGIVASAVKGHREFSGQSTSCPGLNMGDFRKQLSGGSVSSSKPDAPSKPKGKSIATMAVEVINGKHGSGHANRQKSLGISKAEYEKVRAEVNKRANAPAHENTSKTVTQMAKEVIAGKHGNGHASRQKSLRLNVATYKKVRDEVNKMTGGKSTSTSNSKQTVNQMASKIINNKNAPTGHESRRRWLGIDNATYQKVRKEVNRRL